MKTLKFLMVTAVGGVEDGALSALAGLKPGDHVKVIYVEMGDKRIIRSIVKA